LEREVCIKGCNVNYRIGVARVRYVSMWL
jgi:hypothetical protein